MGNIMHVLDVPGTTLILDNAAEASGNNNFTLVPTPSADQDDPLNWSQARKWLQLACVVAYVLAGCLVGGCLYAIYDPVSDMTGLSLDQINAGVGYVYLAQGLGACLTLPLTIAIGKRPVYIISCGCSAIFPFALAHVKTNGTWIGLNIINGFAGSPLFVAPEASLADVFFYHERSLPFGIYVATTYGGAVLAPVLSGYIYSSLGWHGPPYLAGGFCAVVALFLVVFLEETNFKRDTTPLAVTDTQTNVECANVDNQDGDKLWAVTEVTDVPHVACGVHAYDRIATPWPGPRPWHVFAISKHAGGILLRGLTYPFILLPLPIILWTGLIFGIYQIFFNCMAALSSGVLSAEPYNMAPNNVGLTFLSPLLAIVPGAILGGWATDRWTVHCARRNGGISEPEHKLWLMAIPTVMSPIGLLMMSLGVAYNAHWMVFVAGEFALTVAGPLASLLCLTYAFDTFHSIHPQEKDGPRADVQQAAPYLLSLVVFAMCMTFGFNYVITDWAFTWGFKNFAWSSVLVACVINLSSFLMIKFGKRFRRSGAGYYKWVINW